MYDKNKDKTMSRIQLIIVTNEILNKKKIFQNLGKKFEKTYNWKQYGIDLEKAKNKN